MRRRCFTILYVFLLLMLPALLAGCQANTTDLPEQVSPRINPPVTLPGQIKAFPEIRERGKDIPKDYEAVAENEVLRLYVRRASSAVIVEDKRNGQVWRSSPEGLADNKKTNTAWRRTIEVPIAVSYVDADRSQLKTAKVDRGMELRFEPLQDGVRVQYTFTPLKIELGLVYALQNDCMQVTIPDKQVQEKGENGLVAIDLLGFLGATHDGQEGYIVYPDGSGALMYFTSPHPEEVQKISSVIYGSGVSYALVGGFAGNFHEEVTMPVFGMNRGSSGFVSMITNGDFDAAIGVARSGKGIDYNHAWANFIFRRQGRFSLTGGQPTLIYQPDRIAGDRSVRYCFLNGPEASYTGMATRYRDFLIRERGAKRAQAPRVGAGEQLDGAAAAPSGGALMHLGFFMGIEQRSWFLSDMITMTTFQDARSILDDLDRAGVRQVDVSLWNWNQGGVSRKYPQRLPVDARLGGEKALQALSADLHGRGQRLFLQDDYLNADPGAPGVFPYLDAVRGVDGLPAGDADTGYLLNPQVALRKFAARDIPQMAGLGADGLELDAFAMLAIPDKNTRYPLSREGFAASWMQIAAMARERFGAVAMEGSNTYAALYADRLDFVPVDSTHYDLFDETVPFYSIVVHGLVPYSNEPYNLISDGRRMFLRQVEYGAIPMFVLTQSSSAKLVRTGANSIYSSEYSYWKAEVVRQYREMETLAPLTGQFIIDHQKLAEDVYQTTYEDGSQVLVNYTGQPYQVGKQSVPAQDFIVIRGE